MCGAAFDEGVDVAEVGGVNFSGVLGEGGGDFSGLGEGGDFVKEFPLFCDVWGGEEGAGEHELPVEGDGFALEGHDAEVFGVVDEAEAALGGDELGDGGEVAVAVGGGEDEAGCAEAEGGDLGGEGLVVVYDVVGSALFCPLLGFWAGGGGDDGEVCEGAEELNGDGADAACAADDEDEVAAFWGGAADVEALEEHFPCGDGGEGEGGGLGVGEAGGFVADDALVDEVEFAVGAGAGDGAGVEDGVSGFEVFDFWADGFDDA